MYYHKRWINHLVVYVSSNAWMDFILWHEPVFGWFFSASKSVDLKGLFRKKIKKIKLLILRQLLLFVKYFFSSFPFFKFVWLFSRFD